MKHYKGFKRYTPENPLPEGFPLENLDNPYVADLEKAYRKYELTLEDLADNQTYLFWKDENGECWYDLNKTFSADTVKIVYNTETMVVESVGKDAERMLPHGGGVLEIAELPEDFDQHIFKVDEETFTLYRCDVAVNNKNRMRQTVLLRDAVAHFVALSVLPDRTKEETKEYNVWKDYIVAVKRTDISVLEPLWPNIPK